jgi:hypothetical protein
MRSVGSYNTDQASRKELVLTNYELWHINWKTISIQLTNQRKVF